MFSKAIVRVPCKNIMKGITSANLGSPDYHLALTQHREYVNALKKCGLDITILEADDDYPDSTFVEDTALLTPHCAIITNPGAKTRKGEIIEIKEVLSRFYSKTENIVEPGTVEAGDIMMVGSHFYIGLSERTNIEGTRQVIAILNRYEMTGSIVNFKKVLHLKSGVTYLENNNLVASGEFISKPEFQNYNILKIEEDESYASNCVWINGIVLIPKGYPKSKSTIEEAGYSTIELDVSEFRKLDGGLSCLSLRF